MTLIHDWAPVPVRGGEGIGIVTERLLSDNAESHTREDIEELCGSVLGLQKLIVVPQEPGNETGHVDTDGPVSGRAYRGGRLVSGRVSRGEEVHG